MTNAQRIYLYVFFIFAIAYIGTLPLQPYPGNFVIKAIPAIGLSILALTNVTGLRGKLLFAALLFSAAGDVTLELQAGEYFIIGLGFFLITQILYIVTFSRDFKAQRSRIPIVVVLVVYALIMAFVLKPSLNEMMIPVYFYLTVITTMGIFAALRASKSKLVLYGALSFIVSDSILAINRFLLSVPASDYLIMITYYLAQFLIIYGFVKDEPALLAQE
jgi:uncharacterized membrane protein YhhN